MKMRLREYPEKDQKAFLVSHLIDIYTTEEVTGGCLHVLLDDGNFGVDCSDYCKETNDYIGLQIAKLLNEFTPEEQEIIVDQRGWKIMSKVMWGEPIDWTLDNL